MRITSITKPVSTSTTEIRSNILQAMAKTNGRAHDFVGYFSDSDFMLIPSEKNGYRIWAAQKGDVTVLVWERGSNYRDWICQVATW